MNLLNYLITKENNLSAIDVLIAKENDDFDENYLTLKNLRAMKMQSSRKIFKSNDIFLFTQIIREGGGNIE